LPTFITDLRWSLFPLIVDIQQRSITVADRRQWGAEDTAWLVFIGGRQLFIALRRRRAPLAHQPPHNALLRVLSCLLALDFDLHEFGLAFAIW